jgi:hypothetical protein
VKRVLLAWLLVSACTYGSHEMARDGGSDAARRDAGRVVDAAVDAGIVSSRDAGPVVVPDSICRLVEGMCTLEEPGVGCTTYVARRVDVARGCVVDAHEEVACEPSMTPCETVDSRCFTQVQTDGSVATFITSCVWPSMDRDPRIDDCPADVEAAIASNGICSP